MKHDKFDKQAFKEEVERDVKGAYGVVNECTIFYEAMAKVEGVAAQWQFSNKAAEAECWKYILTLANRCFSFIWGIRDKNGKIFEDGAEEYAKEHLNDPSGCPNCDSKWKNCHWPDLDFKARMVGMRFYKALLDLRHAKKTLDALSEVVAAPTGMEINRAIASDEHLDEEAKNALINMVQALFHSKI